MIWQTWFIIIALIGILIAIFKPKFTSRTFGKFKIGKRIAVFATPHRVEMILVFLYAILFLWSDVVQNQILSNNINHRVTWFGSITTPAIDLYVILLIGFHLCLMALFLLSLKSKATSHTFDVFFGTLALFGVAILLTGFLWSIDHNTIRFLFIDMPSLSFYHIGVGLEIMFGLWIAFTK